jgi:hypothetical protein
MDWPTFELRQRLLKMFFKEIEKIQQVERFLSFLFKTAGLGCPRKMKTRLGFFRLFMAIAIMSHAEAMAGTGAGIPSPNFVGVRPAAMGQAFTAVADDQNALYYNPAGLATLQTWSLEILSPFVGWNQNIVDNYKEVKEINSSPSSGGKKSDAVEKIGPIIEAVSGENHYILSSKQKSFRTVKQCQLLLTLIFIQTRIFGWDMRGVFLERS